MEDLKNNFEIDIFGAEKTHFIEPACGEGVFVKELQKIKGNIKLTSLDIDNLYMESITYNFLKTNRKKLKIKEQEIIIFFGCPPSSLTRNFIKHCKTLDQESKIYFLLEENKLENCLNKQVITTSSILKNYGYNAFLFKNAEFTTKGAYLLTRVIF